MAETTKPDDAREVPVYQSANKPNLLMGCDRELLLFVGLIAAALVFSVVRWWAVICGAVAWFASIAILRHMAKIDPLMRQVYIRHVKYGDFYPAKSGLRALVMNVGKTWTTWR
jgi:type IV secretion system protein TrbD